MKKSLSQPLHISGYKSSIFLSLSYYFIPLTRGAGMQNERTTRVVVGNILLSTDTANMHKNWEKIDLTVVTLPSKRRKT